MKWKEFGFRDCQNGCCVDWKNHLRYLKKVKCLSIRKSVKYFMLISIKNVNTHNYYQLVCAKNIQDTSIFTIIHERGYCQCPMANLNVYLESRTTDVTTIAFTFSIPNKNLVFRGKVKRYRGSVVLEGLQFEAHILYDPVASSVVQRPIMSS